MASKLVKFGLGSSISDLHLPIRGHHPVLYFSTQSRKKYSTAMCYNMLDQDRGGYPPNGRIPWLGFLKPSPIRNENSSCEWETDSRLALPLATPPSHSISHFNLQYFPTLYNIISNILQYFTIIFAIFLNTVNICQQVLVTSPSHKNCIVQIAIHLLKLHHHWYQLTLN